MMDSAFLKAIGRVTEAGANTITVGIMTGNATITNIDRHNQTPAPAPGVY